MPPKSYRALLMIGVLFLLHIAFSQEPLPFLYSAFSDKYRRGLNMKKFFLKVVLSVFCVALILASCDLTGAGDN